MNRSPYNHVVYVASPLSGDIENNMAKAAGYCKFVMRHGFVPYAAHLLFTKFLDDNVPEERAAAMKMDEEMLRRVDEAWFFTENGRMSSGMRAEYEQAKKLGIPIDVFDCEAGDIGKPEYYPVMRQLDPGSWIDRFLKIPIARPARKGD